MNRREFIGGIGAAAALDAFALPKGERPQLKLGLFSDTHVKTTPKSFELTAAAFRTFRAQGVDAIAHLGDLADLHYPEAYAMYRAGLDETFGAKMPELIYAYADHDVLDAANWDRAKRASPPWHDVKWAYNDMRERLRIDHGFLCEKTIRGIPFVTIPEQVGIVGGFGAVRELLASVCRRNPGGPVVFLSHRPPADTTNQSNPDGREELRKLLDDFPQVICFHGHTHMPLVTGTNIWQGNFTVVNCGCLYEWFGRGTASPFSMAMSYWVGVAEFYRDRMIVRRYDVRTGEEVLADAVWTVPLPHVAATAPYAPANARRREPKIGYPEGAELKIVHVPAKNVLRVWVPDSADETKVFLHRLRAYEKHDGKVQEIAFQDRLSEYHLMPANAKGGVWFELSDGYFASGGDYRLTAMPVGFSGTEGERLVAKWTAPKLLAAEPLWTCPAPAALRAEVAKKGPVVEPVDGWWTLPDAKTVNIALPREIWDVPVGTRLRFEISLDLRQNIDDQDGWMLNLTPANGYWRKAAIMRLMLPAGKADGFRYVKEFSAAGVEYAHMLTFVARHGGKLRIREIKLSKIA